MGLKCFELIYFAEMEAQTLLGSEALLLGLFKEC